MEQEVIDVKSIENEFFENFEGILRNFPPHPAEYHEMIKSPFMRHFSIFRGISMHITDIPADKEICRKFIISENMVYFCCRTEGSTLLECYKNGKKTGENAFQKNVTEISAGGDTEIVSTKESGKNLKTISIVVDSEVLRSMIKEMSNSMPKKFMKIIDNKDKRYLFEKFKTPSTIKSTLDIIAKADNRLSKNSFFMKSVANEILFNILSEVMVSEKVTRDSKLGYTLKVRDSILENFGQRGSLKQIAIDAGVTQSKMQNDFKKIFEISIIDFLQMEKMRVAKKMLESGVYNVGEAANELGYFSKSQFIASFKKFYSINPGNYLIHIKDNIVSEEINSFKESESY